MLDHGLFVQRNYGLKARNFSYFVMESDKEYVVVNRNGMFKAA